VPWFPPAALPLLLIAPGAHLSSSPDRSAYDLHHLGHVRLALPRLDRVRQAAVNVVLEDQHRDLVRGGGERLDLLQDVEAVRLVADKSLEAARLSLDATEAVQQGRAVLGIRVAEVWRGGIGLHTGGQYAPDVSGGIAKRASGSG
jgi:hypothetical protein